MPVKPPTYMQYYEEDELANALIEMIQVDKDIESRKNILSLKADFNLYDFYNIFDVDNQKRFCFRQFKEVFDLFNLYPDSEFLRMAFVKLDRDIDGVITLEEFFQQMGPRDKNYKDLLMTRSSIYNDKKNFPRSYCFSPDTQRALIGLLRAMPAAEESIEQVRRNLQLRRNFDVREAFKVLDKKNKGFIELNDIRDHLTSRFIFASDSEIELLIARMDRTGNGQASLNDFVREMRPKLLP